MLDGHFQTGFRCAGAASAECRAPEIKHRQRHLKTFAYWPENIFLWHFDVAQREPSGGRAADSHLRHARLQYFEPRHVRRYKKCCDRRFVRARHGRARHDRELVRYRCVGDVPFFTIQNEVRAVLTGACLHLHICRVRPGFFFGERERAKLFAGHQLREPLLSLFACSEQ